MNVALYSFKRLEANLVVTLNNKIREKFKSVDKIYIYTENTLKERMSQRLALKELLKDYENKKINIIVFESIEAIGTDDYIQSVILNKLMKNNIDFYLMDIDVDSKLEESKMLISIKIFMGETIRNENIKRSKTVNNLLNKLENGKVKFYTYCRVSNDSQLK